ncbi:AMP-binding protein [Nocardia stercoris]|uniref:Acyl-CoA synthetase n=1 Tax=Nocardia stercoris TaxID=2483361 RepID=A0A3M2L9G1_9NOCA|nr:AMP-binding protein [Nocardia stercoris]RMI32555.1 acyl-CoA synthetase [Nocardia stercoris]
MVTDVIDVATEVTVPRRELWDLLLDADSYARLFPGIGACEPMSSATGIRLHLRLGTETSEIRTLDVTLIPGREPEALELRCAELDASASVRLLEHGDGTQVRVACVAVDRLHPALDSVSDSVVQEWIRAGLQRMADIATGAPTATVVKVEGTGIRSQAETVRQVLSTGVMRTVRPDIAMRQLAELNTWGFTLAGGYASAAAHSPRRTALIDDGGVRTFAEVHQRSARLAGALAAAGQGAGTTIGVLSRNSAELVEILVAATKLGVDMVLLNTGMAAVGIAEVAEIHRFAAIFAEPALAELLRYLPDQVPHYATGGPAPAGWRGTVSALIDSGAPYSTKPRQPGQLIVLTSGTTGCPKSAKRPHPKGFGPVVSLLSRIPLQMNAIMLIPAPLFHTWGLAALQLSTALRSTVVLAQRFDAEDCLRLVAAHKVTTLIVVPVLVNRILALPPEIRARYDTSSLRVVLSCGAPLSGATVTSFRAAFGEILYNIYGSTEVSWAAIADPGDLRIAPTTAGKPPSGTRIAILGPDRRPVPVGVVGRIFVGNQLLFDGYVDANAPEAVDDMLDTGDLGYLDAAGRLFVAGREDEMISSGGENVFPRPIEEALAYLPQVFDVAVVGVPDREFGQRLAAFIVKYPDSGLDEHMVRAYVRNRLGRFAVPRDVTFVDALPRNATGKILRNSLTGPPGS